MTCRAILPCFRIRYGVSRGLGSVSCNYASSTFSTRGRRSLPPGWTPHLITEMPNSRRPFDTNVMVE